MFNNNDKTHVYMKSISKKKDNSVFFYIFKNRVVVLLLLSCYRVFIVVDFVS